MCSVRLGRVAFFRVFPAFANLFKRNLRDAGVASMTLRILRIRSCMMGHPFELREAFGSDLPCLLNSSQQRTNHQSRFSKRTHIHDLSALNFSIRVTTLYMPMCSLNWGLHSLEHTYSLSRSCADTFYRWSPRERITRSLGTCRMYRAPCIIANGRV